MPWGLFRFSRIVFRHFVASYEAFSLQFSGRVYHCSKQNRLVAGNSVLVPVIRFPLGGTDNAIKVLPSHRANVDPHDRKTSDLYR
jgi:hypothetical protein